MNQSIELLQSLISLGNAVTLATGTVTNSLTGDDRISSEMIETVLLDLITECAEFLETFQDDTDTTPGNIIQFPGSNSV